MDCKILHYLRKKQKIRIVILNNHINYTFIDIITIHHYIHLQASFKEAKNLKMWHYWNIFYLGLINTLSTLEWKNLVYWDFIFHLGPTEPFVMLKKITRNQSRLRSSKSYDSTNLERSQRFLKDLDRFGQVGL